MNILLLFLAIQFSLFGAEAGKHPLLSDQTDQRLADGRILRRVEGDSVRTWGQIIPVSQQSSGAEAGTHYTKLDKRYLRTRTQVDEKAARAGGDDRLPLLARGGNGSSGWSFLRRGGSDRSWGEVTVSTDPDAWSSSDGTDIENLRLELPGGRHRIFERASQRRSDRFLQPVVETVCKRVDPVKAGLISIMVCSLKKAPFLNYKGFVQFSESIKEMHAVPGKLVLFLTEGGHIFYSRNTDDFRSLEKVTHVSRKRCTRDPKISCVSVQ